MVNLNKDNNFRQEAFYICQCSAHDDDVGENDDDDDDDDDD